MMKRTIQAVIFAGWMIGLLALSGFQDPAQGEPGAVQPPLLSDGGGHSKPSRDCERTGRHGRSHRRCDEPPPPGDTPPPGGSSANWTLLLTVTVPDPMADGGAASNHLKAGQNADATDAFDNGHDVRALLAGSVQAYFDHAADANYDRYSKQIWYDIRNPELPQSWEVVVHAGNGVPVTLSWTLPAGEVSCATNRFILQDADGQLPQTDLCATGSFTYTGDGQIRHFVLTVS